MKSELSRQIFGKNADIKIYENLSRWQPSCSTRTGGRLTDGQTDKNDEANSRFSQFRERP